MPFFTRTFFPFSTEEGEHDEHGGEHGGNQAHHGNLGVDGGAGGVLEGVAHGVANDGRLVGVAALAALGAGLNVLLGVVPQAAGVGHEQSQQQAADDIAQQEAANGAGAADEAYDDGGDNGHQTGGDQLPQGAGGGDVNALVVLGLSAGLAFPQALDGVELPVDFRHHALGVFVHAQNQHGGEHGGHHGAHQHAEEHRGAHDVKAGNQLPASGGQSVVCLTHKGAQQGDDRQTGGADGEALGHGLHRVAGAVQLVGGADGLLAQAAHFRQAPGVVHNGAVGVVGDNHAHN